MMRQLTPIVSLCLALAIAFTRQDRHKIITSPG